MYRIPWTAGQWSWQTGQYVQFALSGNSSFPYEGKVYNSNGTLAGTIGLGKIVNMGVDYFFFVGSDNNTGQLFSGSSGMSNTTGVTWTGTQNPTIAQVDAIADSNYSTEPLGAGQAATTTPSSGGSSAPVYTSEITPAQTTAINSAKTRLNNIVAGNRIDLDVNGAGVAVTVEQVGSWNKIGGLGGGDAVVSGNNSTVSIKQGDSGSSRNLIEMSIVGNSNSVAVSQARHTGTGAVDGNESGGHILSASVDGGSNTVVLRQGNDGGSSSGHYLQFNVVGIGNNQSVVQSGNGAKTAFIGIGGSSTTGTLVQSGTGGHFVDLTLAGNGHQTNISQGGAAGHRATISLTNAGGASNLTLVQSGSTAQVYSIQQSCATLAGCSVTVNQGQ